MKKTCMTFIFLMTSVFVNHIKASEDHPTYGLLENAIASLERRHERKQWIDELISFDETIERKWSGYWKLVEESRKPTRTEHTRGDYGGIHVSFRNVVPNTDNSMSKKRDKLIENGIVEIFRSGGRPKVTRTIRSINTTRKPNTYELIDTITLAKGDFERPFTKNTDDLFFGFSEFVSRRRIRHLQQKSQNWNSNSIPGPISMINSEDLNFYLTRRVGDLIFKKTTIVNSFQEGLDYPALSLVKDLPFNRANVRRMKAKSSLSILDKSDFHEGIGAPLLMWSMPTPTDAGPPTEKGIAQVSVLRFLKGFDRDTISLDLAAFTAKMNGSQIDAAFSSCGSSPLYFLNQKELEHSSGFRILFDLLDKRTETAYLQLVQKSSVEDLITLLQDTNGLVLETHSP
ncbi:MAG: hypothetical protein GY809_13925 [Planctomycetes bacterium]|nr:hypothetical protein [Planctomycetota bacterium]